MATLAEIAGLLNDPTLTDKCKSACLIAAASIITEDNANIANGQSITVTAWSYTDGNA